MTVGRVFAFVKGQTQDSILHAIKEINRQRRPPFHYRRLILTASRRGWTALLWDDESVDFFLLRGLSKALSTETFGLSHNGMQIAYRYTSNGKPHAAFESHLQLKLTERLRRLMATQNLLELDLAEPAESLVLYRYRQLQSMNTWEQPSLQTEIPPQVMKFYQGNIQHLKPLLKPEVHLHYVAEVLTPGYSPETIMERLLNALALPYLTPSDEITYPYANDPSLKRVLAGSAIVDPKRWPESQPLPQSWQTLTMKD